MPKQKSSASVSSKNKAPRHNPLSEDIRATGPLRIKSRKQTSPEEHEKEEYIDSKASRRILELGADLVGEEQEERDVGAPNSAFTFESRFAEAVNSDDDEQQYDDEAWGDEDEMDQELELDPDDLNTFHRFLPPSEDLPIAQGDDRARDEDQATNLADIILKKIAAHEAAQSSRPDVHANDRPEEGVELPPKVVEVYTKIGLLLSRYKSGKLPKPFKVLPTLPHWEELLFLTRPEEWTPNACYEATRIFVSGKPIMTQRFLEDVMLSRVRDDIHETKKLNVHLYKALKRALYKPAAFFKGFLFPLVGSGTCTLREAHIVSSVLARVSVPVLHSAAALLRLCDIAAEQSSMSTEGGGATNIFIRVLLEKKYALPYKVVDALVFHFLRFRGADPVATGEMNVNSSMTGTAGPGVQGMKLPVLWHQCLLAFAQRYRNDITEDQREALLDLLLIKGHAAIGPEVRRELLAGRGRGVPVDSAPLDGGDDTMLVDS
ncbi:MAG: snoRNA-binding rRNA-processing protein [Peltula sp. TS41687]|nr:MAG: snoRNA-binding rRNA-processing protein [Peltula sp. TS41687]